MKLPEDDMGLVPRPRRARRAIHRALAESDHHHSASPVAVSFAPRQPRPLGAVKDSRGSPGLARNLRDRWGGVAAGAEDNPVAPLLVRLPSRCQVDPPHDPAFGIPFHRCDLCAALDVGAELVERDVAV